MQGKGDGACDRMPLANKKFPTASTVNRPDWIIG